MTIEEPGSGPAAYREENGLVVFDAEGHQTILAGQNEFSAHSWEQQADALATGGLYMNSTPDVGEDAGDSAEGAALEYNINFTTTGTYYVHVRMRGLITKSDQLHAGLDQPATYGAKAMRSNSGDWEWERKVRGLSGNNRVRIDVDTAGVKQFHIWMREDGVQVDKIILTTDVNYAPASDTDFGPPVSPFDNSTLQAAVQDDSENQEVDSAFDSYDPVSLSGYVLDLASRNTLESRDLATETIPQRSTTQRGFRSAYRADYSRAEQPALARQSEESLSSSQEEEMPRLLASLFAELGEDGLE